MARLAAYDFPGNVRELRNAIEHAMILCTGDELHAEDLPKPMQGGATASAPPKHGLGSLAEARESWLAPLERRYLVDLLAACDGNVRKAAARADVDRATFYRLLERRGVTLKRTPHTDDTPKRRSRAARRSG
jgi:two-component system response regulator AtoC